MTRAEFLAVTGMSVARLTGLQKLRVLPFAMPESDSKWARLEYNALRAALMVAFIELTAGGMSVETAAKALLDNERQIAAGPLIVTPGKSKGEFEARVAGKSALMPTDNLANDVWLAVPATGDVSSAPILNTLSEIAIEITVGEPAFRNDDGSFARLSLVNITQAIRTVQQRASKLKIKLEW